MYGEMRFELVETYARSKGFIYVKSGKHRAPRARAVKLNSLTGRSRGRDELANRIRRDAGRVAAYFAGNFKRLTGV
jgi:hypothetical protein